MLSLHTNAAALTAQNSVGGTQKALSTSMTRLGTGFRVNSAMDDAAGLQIATRLSAQTRGMAVAQRNAQNGISMMQTAEGAFTEITNILLRMKDLATEARNGASNTDDKTAMDAEYQELGSELGNILNNTKFGGQALLNGAGSLQAGAITYQIGAAAAETMSVDVSTDLAALVTDLTTAATLGDITTAATAATAIGDIEGWINDVGGVRAQLGAASNRLDHVYNNLANMKTNTEQARGRIMDVDYASETANMTSKQMLMQAGTSMLKQSSSMSQLVMSLMQ
ncbi:MAG: flagellin [Methyloversatilis discipulorum]|jgi:flagellin|uniref:flagellin N-terminal helical domain-containing protein n=1 Tax=Methyloversatilis TaxID=378210 RepID=UPI00037274DE|nr:flagellin [Methyloversatilis discipulorum]MBT9515647.1 flagellin [Methyloversatilis discipulorum]